MSKAFVRLLGEVRACSLCADELEPRPVLQLDAQAKVLIAGQAPGSKVHTSGIPFDDPSGERLRAWMGVDKTTFYDPGKVAILPMAFCYPGKGKTGDLPPPPRCAERWRPLLLDRLRSVELTLVIGQYALAWHLPQTRGFTLTEIVRGWRDYPADCLPLPHPSPRNNIWIKKNPWFEDEVIPHLQTRIAASLRS